MEKMTTGLFAFDLYELLGVHSGLFENFALFLKISEIIGLILTTFDHRVVAFVYESLYVFAELVVSVFGLLVDEFSFGHEDAVEHLATD